VKAQPNCRHLTVGTAFLVTAFAIAACSKPASEAKDGADKATESSRAFPVVVTSPVPAEFPLSIPAYGTAVPDPREARVIASSTSVEVRSIAVLAGERVRRGAELLSVIPDPSAFLAREQAASALRLAQGEVDRLTEQRAAQLATATQLETAQKALADAKAALAAARSQGADTSVVSLRAPVDGVVTGLAVAVGDRVAAGAPLATLSPLVLEHLTLGIEPAARGSVRTGDRIRLHPAEAPADERTGQVTAIAAAIDRESRLLPVSVKLEPGTGSGWLAGTTLEGTIDGQAAPGFLLPRGALVKDERGLTVFEIADGHARRVAVRLISEDGDRVGVAGALDGNRPVVSLGAYELDDGVAVRERKP
jgi:RND family efflux transporter MFP subunit